MLASEPYTTVDVFPQNTSMYVFRIQRRPMLTGEPCTSSCSPKQTNPIQSRGDPC